MKEIFFEIINEAVNGQVIIDNEAWPCSFNSIINNKELFNKQNLSTLVIKNEKLFFQLLEEYVELELTLDRKFNVYSNHKKNKIKAIIMYLFVNATQEDFINAENLIKKRIQFINDSTFENYIDTKIINTNIQTLGNLKIKKATHSLAMETPYKIEISLTDQENNECPLADISYGICSEYGEKVCYIYSIMKPKEKKEISSAEKEYQKRTNRYLYKLNEGVLEQEEKEFHDYKALQSSYYPENITDVTHAFVLATTIFMSMLQKENISKIKVVPYLPLRYLSRQIAANNIKDEKRKKELENRNNRIQDNASIKFLRTFRRTQYHMGSSMEIINEPYMNDENMVIILKNKTEELNNPILENISNSILTYNYNHYL